MPCRLARGKETLEPIALRGLGDLPVSATKEYKTTDALPAVRDDYASRGARGNRTQYRLYFPLVTNHDGAQDGVTFSLPATATPPVLEVGYRLR
jgi:hypothetical protein